MLFKIGVNPIHPLHDICKASFWFEKISAHVNWQLVKEANRVKGVCLVKIVEISYYRKLF